MRVIKKEPPQAWQPEGVFVSGGIRLHILRRIPAFRVYFFSATSCRIFSTNSATVYTLV